MRVLLVGSGGREHALAWALKTGRRPVELFALPGSDAIAGLAETMAGDPLDPACVLAACRRLKIELVVVGPEAPLAAGLVDSLEAEGIAAFGPGRSAARLESSKIFAKEFMMRHGVATAAHEVHDDPVSAQDAAAQLPLPLVVKADGLASGKGVFICRSRKEALQTVGELMIRRSIGEAGRRVVLEECLQGPELTVMAFYDGKTLKPLPPCRDHKRLGDGDEGPNTGGMGAVSPLPSLGEDLARRIQTGVLDRTLEGLRSEGLSYRGVLYFGLMLTEAGPKVLEFNVRFGDPEAQTVLPLLETDLLDVLQACRDGRLRSLTLRTRPAYSASIVLASPGYPGTSRTGAWIDGIESAEREEGVHVFHAGTKKSGGAWVTAGGRVLAVQASGPSLSAALEKAYGAAGGIRFEGMQYRTDIGSKEAVWVSQR